MPTTLHKIELPSLVNSNFGVNLKNVFENIDSNFQKLSSLGLTTGAAGKPSVWIPYNLNSVFCTELSPSTLSSSYLPAEVIEKIQDDYDKYKAITNRSAYMYVLECILMYNDMLEAIWTDPVDIQYNLTEDDIDTLPEGTEVGEHYWKQKWEKDIELNIDDLRHNEDSDSYTKLYNKIIEVCNVNRAARGLTCCGRTTDSTSENPPITNGNAKMQEYLYDGSHEGPYLPFLPGAIMVAGNMDDAIGGYTKIGTLSHIYIDPRFRSPYVIMGKLTDEELTSLEAATDQSCVVYGTGAYDTDIDNYRLKFDYSYSFPRIHCQDGEFYLKVNDIATNIPLTGRTGKAGKDSQFAIVILDDEEVINLSDYHSIVGEDDYGRGTKYKVGNTIPAVDNWSDKKLTLDGCPALVFPNKSFYKNSYTSVYWMTHLEVENDELVAYCGRENLVEVALYDHSFAGMMMGLDVYEKATSNPAGNTPWYKPRGLMLPIGSRYIDTNSDTWQPGWQPSNEPDTTHFSAHLIYSTGGTATSKKELHISSVKDYRKIGQVEDHTPSNPRKPASDNIFNDTHLFIDEPTIITHYNTPSTHNKMLLEVDGGAAILGYNDSDNYQHHMTGNITIPNYTRQYNLLEGIFTGDHNHLSDGKVTYGAYDMTFSSTNFGGVDNNAKVGLYVNRALVVDNCLDVVGGVGCSYVRANGVISAPNIIGRRVYGRYFAREDSKPGQILLANGYATQEQTGNSSPIRLKAKYGDGSEHTVNLTYHNMSGDNTSYFQNTEPLKCGDRMAYVGGTSFAIASKRWILHRQFEDHNATSHAYENNYWKIATGTTDSTTASGHSAEPAEVYTKWKNDRMSAASPVAIPTSNGLKGVCFSYKSGNIVVTKVLIAANGRQVDYGDSCRTYGLPIGFVHDGGKYAEQVPYFYDMPLCDLPVVGNINIKPLYNVTDNFCSHIAPGMAFRGTNDGGWIGKKEHSVPPGGLSCTIKTDGKVYLNGASTAALFSGTRDENNTADGSNLLYTNDYVEFTFVYPVADVGSGSDTTLNAPSHYVYTGELEAETGKPVVTDMSDTSVWQLADEFEGDSSEITLDVMTTYVGDGESSDPTLYGDSNWTFQNYDDYVAEHQEPEEPVQTEYNYIYTGTLTGGEPDVTDLTNNTVWFAAGEYEGTHGDITARVKATYGGSNRIQHGPGTYGEREWDFDLVLEPHTHYWKCEGTSLPSEGMEMVVGNQVQAVNSVNVSIADYSYEEPDPEWFEDTEVWGLISVTATAKDLSDYTIKYKKANTGAGIEADGWSAKTNASEVTTYQWLGGDNYDIYRYLEQTRMAYYYEGWHGVLFDLANDYKKNQNLSYGGFRGKIEISTGDPSMLSTTLPADMTIDCWNSDLTDHILDHYTISINNAQATAQGSLSIRDHTITIVKSLSPLEWNSDTDLEPSEQYTPGGTNSGSHTPTEVTPSVGGQTEPGETRP